MHADRVMTMGGASAKHCKEEGETDEVGVAACDKDEGFAESEK